MSIKLMHQVWTLRLTPSEATVLAHLADHANDDGLSYPSVGLVAWKSNLSERTVQMAMRSLQEQGLIQPLGKTYGGRGNSTRYLLRLDRGEAKPPYREKGEEVAPFDEKGEEVAPITDPERVQSTTQKGAVLAVKGANPAVKGAATAPEPLVTVKEPPRKERERARGVSGGAVSAAAPAPVPAQFNLGQEHYDFGAELGIPRDRLETETRKFLAHHRSHGNRRRDWNEAWRKWICDVPGFDRSSSARSTPGATNGSRAHAAPQTVVNREQGKRDAEAFKNGTLGRR